MKLKTTAIFAIAISVVIGCTESENKPTVSIPNNSICLDYSKEAPSELPVELIYDMVSKYDSFQLDAINTSKNFEALLNDSGKYEDAEVIWFDLETLKKFIYHIEYETKKRDSSITAKNLGIHVYYTAYPQRRNWDNSKYQKSLLNNSGPIVPLEYEQRHTLVMVPTMKLKNINTDYNPLDKETFLNGLLIDNSNKYEKGSSAKVISIGLAEAEKQNAQNHGGLFPPKKSNGLAFTKY